jgi:plasmid segregation protein ParM
MNDQVESQVESSERPLETVRTETLPEGALFVSPDGVLYQVVMAGSASFRKAEPWPWPSHGWSSVPERRGAVALVPGSLLARNYPVVTEGKLLPVVSRSDFLDPDGQPCQYIFPKERLAKLAAQLDEALAHQSGLAARKEHQRWILSDGRRTFRAYHYQSDNQGRDADLVTRFAEEHIEALACEEGPHYWCYIPTWEKTLSAPAQTTGIPSLEPAIGAMTADVVTAAPEPTVPPVIEVVMVEEPEAQPVIEAPREPQVVVAETATPVAPPAATPATETSKEQPTTPVPSEPEAETTPTEEKATQPQDYSEREPKTPTKTSKGRRTPAMILSIDIGYGYTKGVGPDGLHFSFPSVIGTAEEIRFATDLIRGGEVRPVKYGNWRFFYGEQAVLQSRVQSTIFDRSRVRDHTYKMLFIAALVELAKFMPDAERIKVVTGLPVGFFGDRSEVVKSFEGVYQVTAERKIKFAVESVVVAPQPFGSLFQELLNKQGKIVNNSVEKGRVGIVDVGTYTTDFVVSDELRYVQRLSGSVRIGWSKVISQVQQALGDLYRLELMPHEVDRAVQAREVRVRGEPVSLEPLIEPAVTDIQTAIIARARDLWGEGTSLDMVLVSGGGGPHLYDVIHDVYPHARLLDNAFWANAEGLYRFGQRPATFES